jgi:hypothetical protein
VREVFPSNQEKFGGPFPQDVENGHYGMPLSKISLPPSERSFSFQPGKLWRALSTRCRKQSLRHAPTSAGRPKYLSDYASTSICNTSHIFALTSTLVLGIKRYLILTRLPTVLSLHSSHLALFSRKLHSSYLLS